jgi:hypothetical protein
MKRKQANNNIYELSKTLYGAERFKLVMEVMNCLQKEGRSSEELPRVHTTFNEEEELNDYRTIVVDYIAVNTIIYFYLLQTYKALLFSLSLFSSKLEKEGEFFDNAFQLFGEQFRKFFSGIKTIEELSEKHSVDMLDYGNHKIIDDYLEHLNELKPKLDQPDSFFEEEEALFKMMIDTLHMISIMGE